MSYAWTSDKKRPQKYFFVCLIDWLSDFKLTMAHVGPNMMGGIELRLRIATHRQKKLKNAVILFFYFPTCELRSCLGSVQQNYLACKLSKVFCVGHFLYEPGFGRFKFSNKANFLYSSEARICCTGRCCRSRFHFNSILHRIGPRPFGRWSRQKKWE